MRIGGWSLAALGMSVNAACANFRPPPPQVAPEAAGAAHDEVWVVKAGRGITDPLVVSGPIALLAGTDRVLRAISVDDASERWSRRLPGAAVGGVALRDSVLYLATHRPQGRIVAVNAASGVRLWETSSGEATTGVGIADGLVGVVNNRGYLVALDERTGRQRWARRVGLSRVTPAGIGDAFVIATQDSLLRVETTAGRTTHRRQSPGAVLDGWVPVGRHLVASTGDSLVVAIDPMSLATAWTARVDSPVMGDLAVRGDTIWAVTRIGSLYRVVEGRPERLASLGAPVTTGVVLVGDLLVFGAADGLLRALTADGREVWRVGLSWNITVDPVPLSDGFIALGGDGDLHRFRP